MSTLTPEEISIQFTEALKRSMPLLDDKWYFVANSFLTCDAISEEEKRRRGKGFKEFGRFDTLEEALQCQRDYPGSRITLVHITNLHCTTWHMHHSEATEEQS